MTLTDEKAGEIRTVRGRDELDRISEEVRSRLETIAVFEFVPREKRDQLNAVFSSLIPDTELSADSTAFESWVPVEYAHWNTVLDESNGIPSGFKYVRVIWCKHIGIADEVIFSGKVESDYIEKKVDEIAERSEIDDPVGNRHRARTVVVKEMRDSLEDLINRLKVPGILGQDFREGKRNHPAALFYEVPKKHLKHLKDEKSRNAILYWLHWNPDSPISVVEEKYLIGQGTREWIIHRTGSIRATQLILRLGEPEMSQEWIREVTQENLLVDLSKFLLPLYWSKFRLEELERTRSQREKLDIPVPIDTADPSILKRLLKDQMDTIVRNSEQRDQEEDIFSRVDEDIVHLRLLIEDYETFREETLESTLVTVGEKGRLSSKIRSDSEYWLGRTERMLARLRAERRNLSEQISQRTQTNLSYMEVLGTVAGYRIAIWALAVSAAAFLASLISLLKSFGVI